MNCFMGYNPLATKQVKVTVWVCEQDGATPVAPSNPSEGDCFIVYATDEAVLSNEPTSKKTYTNGDWADAEGGGGGGIVYPTFTPTESGVTCDMTFAEIRANYQASDMGQWGIAVLVHPVYGKKWIGITLTSGSFLDNYEDVPETVSEGFELLEIGDIDPLGLYADDNNFYIPKE